MSGLIDPRELIDLAIKAAEGPCIVIVEDAKSAEVRFANSMVTTNGMRNQRSVSVICFAEHETGTGAGSASRQGDVDVAELVRSAQSAALEGGALDDAFALCEGSTTPFWESPLVESSFEDFAQLLDALGEAFDSAASLEHRYFGFFERETTTTYLGISTGLKKRYTQTTGAMHLVGRSLDSKRSAWAGASSKTMSAADFAPLLSSVEAGLQASQDQRTMPAGRYEVLLTPSCVADLMIDLVDRASGKDAEEGQNVFGKGSGETRVGERLSPLDLYLYSDPDDPLLSCLPFLATAASGADVSVFDNGSVLEHTHWIRSGVLENLRYHRNGALQSGVAFAPPIDNLMMRVEGATASIEEMIAATPHGLLVTCLWYIREVDPETLLLTGLTRDGVYVIEGGKIVGATSNFRFNESPVDLLARATEASIPYKTLGREFGEWENRTSMPALRIPDFHMSSVSQAL